MELLIQGIMITENQKDGWYMSVTECLKTVFSLLEEWLPDDPLGSLQGDALENMIQYFL